VHPPVTTTASMSAAFMLSPYASAIVDDKQRYARRRRLVGDRGTRCEAGAHERRSDSVAWWPDLSRSLALFIRCTLGT
jgi:hypothetical protein